MLMRMRVRNSCRLQFWGDPCPVVGFLSKNLTRYSWGRFKKDPITEGREITVKYPWGFSLTKNFWPVEKALVEPYLSWRKGIPPTFASCGFFISLNRWLNRSQEISEIQRNRLGMLHSGKSMDRYEKATPLEKHLWM